VLHEALGYLECAIDAALPAGDSTLFVARITGAGVLREGPALMMADTPFKHAG
jgi:flavin reductase (DIM6/NTAB) family NADH-FMN oxidoreductase RutF